MEDIYWTLHIDHEKMWISMKNKCDAQLIKKQRLVAQKINLNYCLDYASPPPEPQEPRNNTINMTSVMYGNKTEIPLLKSGLQKCVRRHNTKNAVSIAKRMMEIALPVFLRRWVIIVIEDSHLTIEMNVVFWLYMFFENKKVNVDSLPILRIGEWLLWHVYQSTALTTPPENWYENWGKWSGKDKVWLTGGKAIYRSRLKDLLSQQTPTSAFLIGIMLYDDRTNYYLDCDSSMVQSTIDGNLMQNKIGELTLKYRSAQSLEWENIHYSKNENIQLEAVDFHINPYFCETAKIKLLPNAELSYDEIKKILWV